VLTVEKEDAKKEVKTKKRDAKKLEGKKVCIS
jgi:hypothetical protein